MSLVPPLHALRVFESVSRLGNLGAAAAELHITVGAVSHQLRSLQEKLEVRLFEKLGRRLVLTRRGKQLQQVVSAAIASIGAGIRDLSSNDEGLAKSAVLNLSLPPTLTQTWMSGRIFRFLEENPSVRLNVQFSGRFEAVDWRRTDAAVVYGNPPWPGYWWHMLHGILLTPVCSPQMLRGRLGIRSPADIVCHRLLHEDDGSEWKRWLAQARVPYPGEPDVYFADFGMIMQAARDGHGVALVDDVIASRDLDEGRLVQPISLSVPAAKNYHVICPEQNLKVPAIRLFVDWLVGEVDGAVPLPSAETRQKGSYKISIPDSPVASI